jgi:hypothetical protein
MEHTIGMLGAVMFVVGSLFDLEYQSREAG